MLWTVCACGSCGRKTTNHPVPRTPAVRGRLEQQMSALSSPVLQRLVDAGARITSNAASKWNGRGTRVEFTSRDIGATEMADLRQISGSVFLRITGCRLATGAMKPLDQMENLNSLEIKANVLDDKTLAEVSHLDGLQRFVADSTSVTARGCKFIGSAKNLTHLSLSGSKFGDDALALVGNCESLIMLNLDSTSITDEGLGYIEGLPKVMELSLRDCNITGSGIVYISKLKELRQLTLAGTQISDWSLAMLEQMPHLNTLDVSRTQISDNGLGPIGAIRELRFLFVQGTRITNTGIGKLQQLDVLEEIRAEKTGVTADAQKLLPRVLITLDERIVSEKRAR